MKTMISETTHTGVDKTKRYGWVTKDEPGILMQIDKNDIKIPEEYQRNLIHSKVKEITANWSWIAAGVIVIGMRDGVFWAVDGQHRVVAAWRRSDIASLPCVVFETVSVKQEAVAFLDLNTGRKPVSSIGKFKAMIAAGDESALIVQKTLQSLGITAKTSANKAREIKSIAWAVKRAGDDAERFMKVMRIAADLCDDMVIQQKLLEGLWYLDERLENGVDDKRFLHRLHAIGGQSLIDAANKASAYFVQGGSKVWATGILDAVNKGLHKKFDLINDRHE